MAVSFKTRLSKPAPVTVGCQQIPSLYVDGVPTSWVREIAVLVQKEMTVEGRGYTSEPSGVPDNSSSVLYNGNFHFEQKTVAYETNRINEADMWRIVKTVTIAALYVNGSYVAGKTAFDAGDDTITLTA